MIINKRKIGERSGYFTGVEIEHTKFYGLSTIFFSNYTAASTFNYGIKHFAHIFFGVCNRDFFNLGDMSQELQFDLLVATAKELIDHAKFVTFELTPAQAVDPRITKLRESSAFCAMICVEVPLVGLGNFAIKAVPTHVFEHRVNERYVATIDSNELLHEKHITSWEEYAADVDGDDASN